MNPSAPPRAGELILIRHGESEWNRSQRFTGWADVGLTERGREQMRRVAAALARAQRVPEIAWCSTLLRCRQSLDELLATLHDATAGAAPIETRFDWRLNERHYGALTGQSKPEAVRLHGPARVHEWRRSHTAVPPPATPEQQRQWLDAARRDGWPAAAELPRAESLAQVVERVERCWTEAIRPCVLAGRRVLVVGHGNSLRALSMILQSLSPAEVTSLEVPNAQAVIYRDAGQARMEPVLRLDSGIATASAIL